MIIFLPLILLLVAVIFTFSIATVIGLVNRNPYVASEPDRVRDLVTFAQVKKGERAIDIGSGDGRIVLALAKEGAQADGCEINLPLVLWSRIIAWRTGLSKQSKFFWKSYWKTDFSKYTLVTLYGLPYVMEHLEPKLRKELPKGARVLSNGFRFKEWPVSEQNDQIYVYIKN